MEPGPAQSDLRISGSARGRVPHRPCRSTIGRLVVFLAGVVVVGGACSPSNPEPSASTGLVASSGPSAAPSASPAASGTPRSRSTPTITSPPVDRPLAASGLIALVHQDGSLWLMDIDGRSAILADTQDGVFGFPTWSPDASRIAAIRTSGTEAAILVFDLEGAKTGLSVVPRAIFQSKTVGPFYLSWTPDGKTVSFLANDADSLALRIAPANGSAPLDGSGPGAVIRTGSPLYFDWIDSSHLFAHIGSGADTFLGEIGRDGDPVGPATKAPGLFRSADVSGDGRYTGFVRAGKDGADAVVVAARKGSAERSMPVFGMAAVDFSPTDDTLASIGAVDPAVASPGFPLGPLRVIDARSGETRTLLDGTVVSFAWSPDGRTIAAIRVIPVVDGSAVSSASPATSSAPGQRAEVRLAFVDVKSGKILSQPLVSPGQRYVNALLAYFDQYALSHRLWAPDSSSILLPQVDSSGATHVDVLFPDGDPPVSLDGEIGFWSP